MALTITPVKGTEWVAGRLRGQLFDVTFDNSYVAGGMAVTGREFNLGPGNSLLGMRFVGGNIASGALLFAFDHANSKIVCLYPSGGGAASPAALADPAITAGGVAVTSAAANGAADLTPGRGKEVAAATNLTTISVRVDAFGFQ